MRVLFWGNASVSTPANVQHAYARAETFHLRGTKLKNVKNKKQENSCLYTCIYIFFNWKCFIFTWKEQSFVRYLKIQLDLTILLDYQNN